MEAADGLLELEGMLCDEHAKPTDMPISLLKSITNNFSEDRIIGSGGFAIVYKGLLQNGAVVAVKKLDHLICIDEKKYNQEVSCLMTVKHKNIVRFLGYCADTQGKMLPNEGKLVMADVRERLLCFEYVPKGTLESYIRDASNELEWRKRYQIIKGICEGLHYLHEKKIVHSDLKPANILLDDNMVPKISDFGISRIFDQEQSWAITSTLVGTMGYLPPESYSSKKITFKFDIYSFGVIIGELLTGQKGYLSVEEVLECWRNKLETSSAIDTLLKQVRLCAEISHNCLDRDPDKRPTIGFIIEMLEQTESMGEIDNQIEIQESSGSRRGFNDDEPIPISAAGKVSVKADHSNEAPLAATIISVLLDVTSSSSSTSERVALDLVVVLDVSGSMRGDKLDQVKSAVQFVAKKLGPRDRLCVVTFSNSATRLCPLRVMSEAAKLELQHIIGGLGAGGGTNIQAGLETGLGVVNGRHYMDGRTASIMLMSDGEQNHGDATKVGNPRNVPVYTVALGAEADTYLLRCLAVNGGTFSFVPVSGDTSMLAVFSQLVAGLLTVTVKDLYLILSKPSSSPAVGLDKILKVAAGDYKATGSQFGNVTVKFADLFSGEARKVVVDLFLSAESPGRGDHEAGILDVAVSYTDARGTRQLLRSQTLYISRTASAATSGGVVNTGVRLQAELARQQHAGFIRATRSLADNMMLDDAREKLVEAQNALEDIPDEADPELLRMLRAELRQLLDRMESHELYKAEGRPYALAAETSHACQRFAARGDAEEVRLYATPRMDTYLEQARLFAGNPDTPLPVADEDADPDAMTRWWNKVAGTKH